MKTRKAAGENPLCGDSVTIEVGIEDGKVITASWEGYGCSLCEASAEYLVERAIGSTCNEISTWELEEVIESVSDIPVGRTRRKCISLPLEALKEAVGSEG